VFGKVPGRPAYSRGSPSPPVAASRGGEESRETEKEKGKKRCREQQRRGEKEEESAGRETGFGGVFDGTVP